MAMIKHFVIVLHGEQSPGISDTPVALPSDGFLLLPTTLGQIPISQSFLATRQGNPSKSLTPNFMMLSDLIGQINENPSDGNTIVIDEMAAPGGVFLSTRESNQVLMNNCLKNPIWKEIVADAAGRQRSITTDQGFAATGESEDDPSFKGAGLLGTQIHEYSASGTNWFFDHLVQTDYGDPNEGKDVRESLGDFGVFSLPLIPPPSDPMEALQRLEFLNDGNRLRWEKIMQANDEFLLTEGKARQIRISDLMLHLIHHRSQLNEEEKQNVQYQFSFVICNPPLTHPIMHVQGSPITGDRLAKIGNKWIAIENDAFDPEHLTYWLMVFYTDFLRFYLYDLGKKQFLEDNSNLRDVLLAAWRGQKQQHKETKEEPFGKLSNAPCLLHTTGRYAVMDDEERQEFIINIGNYLKYYPIWLEQKEVTSDPLYKTDIKGIMEYILKASTTPIFEKFDERVKGFWGISQLTRYPEGYTATLSKHIFPKILARLKECFDKDEKKKVGYYYELLQYVNQKHYPHSSFFATGWPGGPSGQQLEKFKEMCQQIQQNPDQYDSMLGGKKHKSHKKRKKTKRRKKKSNKKSRRKKKTRKHRRKRKKTKLIYRR